MVLPVARCDEKRMVRMSAPWLDWKAVRTWIVGRGEVSIVGRGEVTGLDWKAVRTWWG